MEFILSRKKILITNDDGIESEGLKILAQKLSEVGDVYILAPDSNRSAVSSQMTRLHKNLEFKKYGEKSFSCSGTPVDCVLSAFRSPLLGVKFDCVFSGINCGPNMGTDVIYSGTCAAARQAVLYGVPGIAVSLASDGENCNVGNFNYVPLAEFCRDNLDRLVSMFQKDAFLSINACSSDKYSGVVNASLCVRNYEDFMDIKETGDGLFTGAFRGGKIISYGSEDCDDKVAKKNNISVTLIYAEPVAKKVTGSFDFTV